MKRRPAAAIVASPVLVGSVTVLIAIIAVFIAYNANVGLPFVPTYDVKAVVPNGAKLVEGNEVRVGGFRVGVVEKLSPTVVDGKARAVVDLKLDKVVEPLSSDTAVRIRPRSALGLKYVELTPGRSRKTLAPGDALPLENASQPLDLEDVLGTFDERLRDDSRAALDGFGDAFAARGQSLNTAIGALNPFFRSLVPVMRNLSDPGTELDNLFRQLGEAAGQAAPVAAVQARLFTDMADTFAAIGRNPTALQATIEKSPPTLDTAIRSFAVQRPFLADLADLSRRLRPAVRELPGSLPPINAALRTGTPILPQTVELSENLGDAFGALDELFENPNTLLALRDLRTALRVGRPALEFIAPYQTVCNYWNYFWLGLGEHQSQPSPEGAGTVQNQGVKLTNIMQPNHFGTVESSRPVDVPPNMDPLGAKDALGNPLARYYDANYQPAIDAQGNADCQQGQNGQMRGPLTDGFRYGPGVLADGTPTGGNWDVTVDDYPGLRGGTYKSIELGIDNLADVP
jgi:virulence factor Mce-like protein